MPQGNQHKPCPPEEQLRPLLTYYHRLKKTHAQVAQLCLKHIDRDTYGISASSVKRYRKKWGLLTTRQQKHTLESIRPYVLKIRRRFPHRGARSITDALCMQHKIHAPRELVELFLHLHEPESVARRRRGRLRRRRYWSAGVHDVWSQDQHDKWKRFGLYLHCSIEVHSGYINWLKVWWTNRNPRLITSYYLEAARKLQAVPLVTQSDPGSENYGVANAHTVIRRQLDPNLGETLQHRWMRKHTNIKPEILWSNFRSDFAPGFEAILQEGIDNGWYEADNELDRLVFLWLAIPWLQEEINIWVDQRNFTSRRANKNKVTPHGIPAVIIEQPELFQSADFKVNVPEHLFHEIEHTYAPPDHDVFKLVPPAFEACIKIEYDAMDSPQVSSDNFWQVYRGLLQRLEDVPYDEELATAVSSVPLDTEVVPVEDQLELLPLAHLRAADQVVARADPSSVYEYAGGLAEPVTPSLLVGAQIWVDNDIEEEPEAVDFTASEPDEGVEEEEIE